MSRLGRRGNNHRFQVTVDGAGVEEALPAGAPGFKPVLLIGKPVIRQVMRRVRNSNASRMPEIRQEYRNKPASPNSSTLDHDTPR